MSHVSSLEWNALLGGDVYPEVGAVEAPAQPIFTVPNLITLSGYAAGAWWLAGGSPLGALWSLWADELDGEAARNLGQTSDLGAALDTGVDWAMAAMILAKFGLWWMLPGTLLLQVLFREAIGAPPFGSVRAAATVAALLKGF